MGKQSPLSTMAAEAFCREVDIRCMKSIDVSAFKNASLAIGAMQDATSFKLQADLDAFKPVQPDGNSKTIV